MNSQNIENKCDKSLVDFHKFRTSLYYNLYNDCLLFKMEKNEDNSFCNNFHVEMMKTFDSYIYEKKKCC